MNKILIALAFLTLGSTYANFTMTPYFILLTEDQPTSSVRVVNNGNKSQTYNVGFIQLKQDSDGSYINMPKPSSTSMIASPYILIGKNSILIKPSQSQLVRLQAVFREDMADGEYRSHLYVEEETAVEAKKAPTLKGNQFGFDITANYGMTIPVLVRKGDLDVKLAIDSVQAVSNQTENGLMVNFTRSGNRSVRGEITLSSNGQTILTVSNIAFYTDTTKRNVLLALTKEQLDQIKGKQVTIQFDVSKDDPASWEKVSKNFSVK